MREMRVNGRGVSLTRTLRRGRRARLGASARAIQEGADQVRVRSAPLRTRATDWLSRPRAQRDEQDERARRDPVGRPHESRIAAHERKRGPIVGPPARGIFVFKHIKLGAA